MAGQDIGPRIGLEGSAEFQRALRNITQQCKELDAEMKAVTSSFDANDSSQDKLNAQLQVLGRQIDTQRQKINLLNDQYDKATTELGRLGAELQEATQAYGAQSKEATQALRAYQNQSTAVSRLQTDINKATTALNKMEQEQADITEEMQTGRSAFDRLTDSIDEQESELQRLKKQYSSMVVEQNGATDEAQDLAQQIDRLSSELSDNRNKMRQAAQAADDLDNSLEDASDSGGKMEVSLGSLGDILGGNAIVDGVKDIVGGIKDLVDASQEYRRIMASLETSSQLAGYSAEQTAESYGTLIGVLGDTQTAATTTANLQALNLEQSELQELIDGTIGSWAKFGDSIPIDSLAESITETARVGEVTGTLADVLNWTAGEEDSFNEELSTTKDVSERANKIIQKLADYGLTDLGKQWQENNKGMMEYNQASDDLQGALADLGEAAEPVLTDLIEFLADLLELINQIVKVLGPLFEGVTGSFAKLGEEMEDMGFDELKEKIDALSESQKAQVEQIIATESAGLTLQERYDLISTAIDNVSQQETWFTEVTEGVKNALDQASTASENNTVKLGEQALAYQNMGTGLQDMTVRVAETMTNMQNAVSSAVQSQMDIFSQFEAASTVQTSTILTNMQSQVDGFNNWGEQLSQLANSTKTTSDGIAVTIDEELLQYLAEMGPEGAGYVAAFNQMTGDELARANDLWRQSIDIKNMTTSWGEDLKTGVGELAAGGEAEFEQLSQRMNIAANSAGEYTGEGFIQGLKQTVSQAEAAAEEFGDTNLDALKAALGVSSPSKITQQYGIWTAQGLSNGLRSGQTDVITASRQLAQQVENTIRNGLNQSTFYNAGLNAAYGMANGIRAGRSSVVNAAASVAAAAASAARSRLQIHSPSKVFEEIGEYTTEGFAQGIENSAAMAELERNMNAMFARAQALTIASQNYAPITDAIRNIPAGNTDIQIVVNAAEGQDANEIANAVMYKIQHAVNQKKAVWG